MPSTWRRLLLTVTMLTTAVAHSATAQSIKASTWAVRFPTSVSGAAQQHFLNGLTAYHLCMFEDGIREFREAQRLNPTFAMAYWGEALSHHRPIWSIHDRAAARGVLDRLAATAEARAAKAPTAREKAYLAALETLYADGATRDRERAYSDAMGRLSAQYPDDIEALALYSLSRVMIYPRTTHARERMETAAMTLEVLSRNPLHPGAPRYLIQSADDPEHAPLGMIGVRALKAWPEAGGSESVHIPSHVYVQLGLWDEAEQVNAEAFALSMAWTKQRGSGLADLNMHNYEHLLRWRQYALLQLGRIGEARALIDRSAADFKASNKATPIGTALYRLRAQFMVETAQWSLAADLARDARADGYLTNPFVLQAVGLGAARSGQMELAREVAGMLQRQRDWRSQAEFHQVMGLVELSGGNSDAGLKHLEQSVAIDEQNIASHGLGVPEPSKPVWELYGEALLDARRPDAALAQFVRGLDIYRGRAALLSGAARSSRLLGDRQAAERYEAELRKVWHRADTDHAGARELRRTASN